MPVYRLLVLLAALALPLGSVQALTWDETINGDLSDDGNAPTLIGTLDAGVNLFSGTMGALGGGPTMDADVWNFTIAAGYYLTGINLVDYSAQSGSLTNESFMAIANGGTIDFNDPLGHLSNTLWGYGEDGFGNTYVDLLSLLDAGPMFAGIGFDGPLPSGNYTFWIQEGSDQINYGIEFVTAPVPVPEPGSLFLLGVAGMWSLRRRRRR